MAVWVQVLGFRVTVRRRFRAQFLIRITRFSVRIGLLLKRISIREVRSLSIEGIQSI